MHLPLLQPSISWCELIDAGLLVPKLHTKDTDRPVIIKFNGHLNRPLQSLLCLLSLLFHLLLHSFQLPFGIARVILNTSSLSILVSFLSEHHTGWQPALVFRFSLCPISLDSIASLNHIGFQHSEFIISK